MGSNEETRNLILAVALSVLVIVGWYALFPPEPPEPPASQTAEQDGTAAPAGGGVASGGGQDAGPGPAVATTREGALAQTERVAVESEALSGSISLEGGRLDALKLNGYRETIDPESPRVTLLNPTGGPEPYYVVYGWLPTRAGNPGDLPGPNTPWQVVDGDTLTPASPVTLEWENDAGLVFRREIAMDDQFMFTVRQTVRNTTGAAVELAPYGYVARRGQPDTRGMWILHEGAVATFDEELVEIDYDDMLELAPDPQERGRVERRGVSDNGWLGFTDKYWMTTLIPEPGQDFTAVFKSVPNRGPEFRTEMRLPAMTVRAGETAEMTTRIFAGAKEVQTIQDYQAELGIDRFEDSVDWGWFYFLTKPLFTMLHWFSVLVGNMGWAIIALTFVIKAILFPLAYKSYVSMSKMKALQPEMEKIKERAGDDKQRMQREMMELYKKEKVNPASGCLPILLQIPIFFSLYKVLFVTIEMRHAPWIGWIEDLSAPDPTSWMNLFGALPYEIPAVLSILSIGVLPITMGVTMWLQQKLNPAPTDATQQMIFAWMPWVFMFILGQFAAGLVLYWTANNVITILQQYIIMRSQGVEVDLFGNIKRSLRKTSAKPVTAGVSAGAAAGGAAKQTDSGPGEASTTDGTDASTGSGSAETEAPRDASPGAEESPQPGTDGDGAGGEPRAPQAPPPQPKNRKKRGPQGGTGAKGGRGRRSGSGGGGRRGGRR